MLLLTTLLLAGRATADLSQFYRGAAPEYEDYYDSEDSNEVRSDLNCTALLYCEGGRERGADKTATQGQPGHHPPPAAAAAGGGAPEHGGQSPYFYTKRRRGLLRLPARPGQRPVLRHQGGARGQVGQADC